MEYLVDRIRELVGRIFVDKGYDLVDLVLRRESGRLILKFLVDLPSGGITIAECAALNAEIGKVLDEVDLIQEGFALEVSSPGIDRPLRTQKDFERKINRQIRVFTLEPVGNKIEFLGKLVGVNSEAITVLVDAAEVAIPLEKINRGKEILL